MPKGKDHLPTSNHHFSGVSSLLNFRGAPPKTNECPLKINGWFRWSFPIKTVPFKGTFVSFWGWIFEEKNGFSRPEPLMKRRKRWNLMTWCRNLLDDLPRMVSTREFPRKNEQFFSIIFFLPGREVTLETCVSDSTMKWFNFLFCRKVGQESWES